MVRYRRYQSYKWYGFAANGKTLYHSDTRAYKIKYNDEGLRWNIFTKISNSRTPDGMVVAEDGSDWVALANGGKILVLDSDGISHQEIPAPLSMVTIVCFGGSNLQGLYILLLNHEVQIQRIVGQNFSLTLMFLMAPFRWHAWLILKFWAA